MTRRLLGIALTLLLSACTAAQPTAPLRPQELAGVIKSDLTLSGEILLSGDLLILPGVSVTLLPGTTLRIRTSESSKIDPEYLSSFTEILVRGTLNAEGTAAAPILFLPETPAADGEVAWAGITFERTSAGLLRHCRIEGAEQGILLLAATPQITENLLRNCRYGIVVQGAGGAMIRDNLIEAGEGGLFVLNGAAPEIVGNRIKAQSEEGLFVDRTSQPRLGRNDISGNDIGLLLHNPGLPFERSNISGNREDIRIIGEGE